MELDLAYNLDELLLQTKYSIKDIEDLRSILPENIPGPISNKQLLLFLNACRGKVEDARDLVGIYVAARKAAPEHFRNRDPSLEAIQQCFQNQTYFVIPPTTKENCPIVYHKITNPQASQYFFDNALKTYIMTMDYALYKYGPRPGIIYLHDMEHVGFSHLFRANISSIRKFLHYIQDAIPAEVCRIHILNVKSLFHKILALVKPFMKHGLLDVIHIHEPGIDMEDFYKTWIPRSHLPSDYGGDLGSVHDMNENFGKELMKIRDYFLRMEEIDFNSN